MIKHILRPLGAMGAALGIFAIASCSDVYTGGDVDETTASFGAAETTITQGSSSYDGSLAFAAKVNSVSNIDKTAADSTVTVTFTNYSKLSEASVADAVSFWNLADNATYSGGYPTRTSKLSSSVLNCVVNYGWSNSVTSQKTTSVTFSVDTSAVTNAKIAVLVDATKLKDARGNLVLNGDGNEKAGEETDSIVKYVGITETADGSTPETLSFISGENFAPAPNPSLSVYSLSETSTAGVYKASVYGGYPDYTGGSAETKYNDGLAQYLNDMYSVQYLEPNSTEWKTDTAFSFAYDGETHYYTAKTSAYATGTKYRLVTKTPAKENSFTESANSEILYGHPAFKSYRQKAFTAYSTAKTVNDDPTDAYILSVSEEKTASYIYESTVSDEQKALFDVEKEGDTSWTITLKKDGTSDNNQLEFATTDGFLATVYKDGTLTPVDISVIKINSKSVLLSLRNSAFSGAVYFWVGSGTTLKQNYTNDGQVKFGYPATGSGSVTDGYVQIDSIILGYDVYDTASSTDIGDYRIVYIGSDDIQYFPVVLEKGKAYRVEIFDGYSKSSNLTDAGYSPACDAMFYLYNSSKAQITSGDSGFYISASQISDGGIYYIGVKPYSNGNTGYAAFHIYRTN